MSKNKQNQQEEHPNTENSSEEVIEETSTPTNEEAQQEADDAKVDANEQPKADTTNWNDKYIRLYAEFDNFKRRTLKERMELMQTANKEVIISLLSVLDDFDRAIKSIETANDIASVKEGVALIQNKLKSALSQKGLKEMDCKGQTFDADFHEGITNIPAPEESLKGKVIDELEKGYLLNDKVIRFAKVIIGA